jgi:hypothetical protein
VSGRKAAAALLATGLALGAAPAAKAGSLSIYISEDQAQQHCPHDTIVWLNVTTRVYALKGQPVYGHGQKSAFACKAEADAAGARSALKGP